MLECDTTATGLAAADMVLKTADCPLFKGTTVCPGKYLLVFGGQIAAVREAYSQVEKTFAGHLYDGFVLGNAAPGLLQALANGSVPEKSPGHALGILETFSASAAVYGADAALKAANIQVMEIRLAQGMAGKGMVYLCGPVAAVQAALAAASEVVKQNGGICTSGCLAAPHPSLWQTLVG
jgi:microcompartment protein CcmL/EutN